MEDTPGSMGRKSSHSSSGSRESDEEVKKLWSKWTAAHNDASAKWTSFMTAPVRSNSGRLYPNQEWSWIRRACEQILLRPNFEHGVGLVVLANFICVAIEANWRADHVNAGPGESLPTWLRACNIAFISFYTLEAAMRLYVERMVFFTQQWNVFDFVIVVCGLVGEAVEGAMDSVSVLRTVRLLRLLRMARLFVAFQELWALIRGLMGCMRTLFWALCLVFTTLTVWSIFAVELLHPLMLDMKDAYNPDVCDWCPHAFASVMEANLTFFQVMSGDGWSVLARPLIQKHPWTAIVFLGVIFTMSFGLLNLITAVIVDNAAQGRILDQAVLASERQAQRKRAYQCLLKLCRKLDVDNSGSINKAELERAATDVPEFAHMLQIMDIDQDEMNTMWEMLDVNRDGHISYDEFVESLWKIKNQDSHTILMYILNHVSHIEHIMTERVEPSTTKVSELQELSEHISEQLTAKSFSGDAAMDNLQDEINDLRGLLSVLLPPGAAVSTTAPRGASPLKLDEGGIDVAISKSEGLRLNRIGLSMQPCSTDQSLSRCALSPGVPSTSDAKPCINGASAAKPSINGTSAAKPCINGIVAKPCVND